MTMKHFLVSSIRLSLVCMLFFSGVYPLFIWCIAQAAPEQGRGELLRANSKVVGYVHIAQRFSSDAYFSSRPSVANYDASASVGSNKGPSNPDYLLQVQARTDTFLVHNPGLDRSRVPAELVTASGSGLDPDISLYSAMIQVERIADQRSVNAKQVEQLVLKHHRRAVLGVFGPSSVNVAQLNIDLDAMYPLSNKQK